MGKITLDPVLRAKLNGLNEEMEVRIENDETVGMFLPQSEYNRLMLASMEIPFSEEEKRKNAKIGWGLFVS